MESGDQVFKLGEVYGFSQKGDGAQSVGATDVMYAIAGGEDDDHKALELRMRLDPLEDRKAISTRHFEVKQNKSGIGATAGEVSDGFASAGADINRILNAKPDEGAKNDVKVVLRIVH